MQSLDRIEAGLELNVRTAPTRVSLRPGAPFRIGVRLNNRSSRWVRLWDPKNTEGSMCLFGEIKSKSGQMYPLESLPIARAAGVPTSIQLPAKGHVDLVADFAWSFEMLKLRPGNYDLTIIYRNSMQASGPVRGVWVGALRSKPLAIELIKG